MKFVLLLLCVAFAGCGAKSNEEKAKDLITEKLKSSLPDFDNYESLNFGTLGTAYLPYEETVHYVTTSKNIKGYSDSLAIIEKMASENKGSAGNYKEIVQQLTDSIKAKNERLRADKQSYTPEKLFKLTHSYKLKDKAGLAKTTEDEFYIDKDLTTVVKVHKVY